MSYRAGRLRTPVTIQNRTITRDALGQAIESWATVATVRAEVRPTGGQERMVGGGDVPLATVTHRITMRYRDDVTPLSRLLVDGRVFDVEAADPQNVGRKDMLICRCVERVGDTG
ncbi:MAG: phage head closure protein [Caldilineaceae bacterium]|nr:phage head closure protein [Caldilineaceae bacterium]